MASGRPSPMLKLSLIHIYKEICKERGIDPNAKAEPETAPIEQPTGNLTYYVAECMELSLIHI